MFNFYIIFIPNWNGNGVLWGIAIAKGDGFV